MAEEVEKSEILMRLLRVAAERWGKTIADEMLEMLEIAADAIWRVEKSRVGSGEEPAQPEMIFRLANRNLEQ